MALIVFENNSNGLLSSDIDNVTTTITLGSGQGANFPSVVNPDEIFFITLQNYAAQLVEICRVTDRSGDVLTVQRGQDGTIARSWTVADTVIQLRVTKETLETFVQQAAALTPDTLVTVNTLGQLTSLTDGMPQTWEYFTSIEGQTAFNTTASLPATDDRVQAFINGVRQFPPSHFTVTGAQQVTFVEGLAEGDYVAIGV
jgi:plasmid maintenance system antidote protein VapI